MAFDPAAFNPAGFAADFAELSPIFRVDPVHLQFQVASDFAAVQVANNVIILALVSGRILRIDLANPQDVDDIDLPRKVSEVGTIRKVFLDPTASHLIITTTHGENFYLHSRSTKPRPLPRLKGVFLECVAWSPQLPSASTREILLGARDGSVWETYLEAMEESFMRREDKYTKIVYKTPEAQPVSGIWFDMLPGRPELRRVIITTASAMMHWVGKIQRYGQSDNAPIFPKFFELEAPSIQDFRDASTAHSMLSISPESTDEHEPERKYAWLTGPGVFHGKLLTQPATSELGTHVFSTSKLFSNTVLSTLTSPITSVALTLYHIIILCGTDIYAINRLDDSVVFQEAVVDPGTKVLGLCSDAGKSTFWMFTTDEIYEVVVNDEGRDLWKILLADKSFDAAQRFAKTPAQKDEVSIAQGDHLISYGKYIAAAEVYGTCSKSFEEVALTFLENGEQDALRKYLLTKLSHLKKSQTMQRIMVASWLIEVFMSRLNSLEDSLSTITSHASASTTTPSELQTELDTLLKSYEEFITKYRTDLDRKTTYEIISSHGRESELLFYANTIKDYRYVLAYWVQREKWPEALAVLRKQHDPEMFYKYSSVLMAHAPIELVDILKHQSNLNPRNLIPALLNYNKFTTVPLSQNQALSYLLYEIHTRSSTDAAIHNTLISIYASHPSRDETPLLAYLESHPTPPLYDSDFALRLCLQNSLIQSGVHIYSSMHQYADAVKLALSHNNITLASIVADRPLDDPPLRKSLWLSVARSVIASSTTSIRDAISFVSRCELLKIEDLIPFFPDFTVIDDFKDEICSALEDYSHSIEVLKKEMDESARTAQSIELEMKALDKRYAIVEQGERCYVCQYPLLSRSFFVFPCMHAFHSDCLTAEVVAGAGVSRRRRVKELQGVVHERGRGAALEELEREVAAECILCSEFAIRRVDEPFVVGSDELAEWAL